MHQLKKFLPHLLVILGFIIIATAYFNPVLKGKEIYQSDIAQYIGMSKQQKDYEQKTGKETYWTDAAFGGMPTYQLGAYYPHNYIKQLDLALRFLPRPADYLFLYFIGFYILLLCMKVDYKLAAIGALAFGFSTYFIILLGVGHNSKAHAIAYMPMVLGGIILSFRQKYLGGFLLLAFAMALEIEANHFQMTYYLLILVIILGITYLIDAFQRKWLAEYFKALGIMLAAVILAVGVNATNLLATQEYTAHSTRGKSDLSINPDGSPNKATNGLDFNYITAYSYGILESFNIMVPRFMGGSSGEKLDKDSAVYSELIKLGAGPAQASNFTNSAPTYWGDQPYVGAPAYIGASLIFLFVFALFLIRGRLKWWIIAGSLLALFLSWGKNFESLTRFFVNYVPLYSKFRAVSSIQVLLELCIPILAIFGLSRLFSENEKDEDKLHALKWAGGIVGGLLLVFILFKSILFSFSGGNDAALMQQLGLDFMRALKEDRKSIFTADSMRSLLLVGLSVGFIWLYLQKKISQKVIALAFGILFLFDLVPVDRRYVNNDDFVSSRQINKPFTKTQADAQILQDSSHYRVFDVSGDPFNTGRTSYFHNAIGGYHAAKPGRMSDLYSFYISQNKMEILNMLNTKYFIIPSKKGAPQAQQNPDAMGNAWLVKQIKWVPSANKAIVALGKTNLKEVAVVNEEFRDSVKTNFKYDAAATIRLTNYAPNRLIYQTNANTPQLAVFSEMYYQPGWQAYIDGKKVTHVRANYVLRAMNIPGGKHQITFVFEPQVIETGSTISLASSILLVLLLLGGVFYSYRKRRKAGITEN